MPAQQLAKSATFGTGYASRLRHVSFSLMEHIGEVMKFKPGDCSRLGVRKMKVQLDRVVFMILHATLWRGYMQHAPFAQKQPSQKDILKLAHIAWPVISLEPRFCFDRYGRFGNCILFTETAEKYFCENQ